MLVSDGVRKMVARTLMDGFCPNCRGIVEDERLLEGGVCRECLPALPPELTPSEVAESLERINKLKDYRIISDLSREYDIFKEEFTQVVGHPPWALQEVWAKRVIMDENFAIVAPTGVGKTVFCLVASLYLIKYRRRKCYLMLPSSIMVEQISERALKFAEKIGVKKNEIVYYHAGLSKQDKDKALEKIKSKRFRLLITTDRFIVNRMDVLKGVRFDNIFVDDVDSFLKSPKNIDRVVELLGFEPEIVEKILKLVELRRRLAVIEDKELEKEYRRISREIEKAKKKKHGLLVVAGATLKAKITKRVLIFSELLGFELGSKPEFVRNIVDFYLRVSKESLVEKAVELVKRHGRGALVFVPMAYGRAFAKTVAESLEHAGLKTYLYEKMEEDILEKFTSGEYHVLVGIASSRSPLARGIDLPETIRYAVFVGVPRREIRIEREEYNPNKLYAFLTNLLESFSEPDRLEALKLLQRLRKIVPVNRQVVERVKAALESGERLEGYEGYVQQVVERVRTFISKTITPEFVEKIAGQLDVAIRVVDEGFSLIIPDLSGYLQASGRTSRLYAAGVSRGVSIVLVEDEKTFHGLTNRLRVVLEEFDWVKYSVEEAEREFRLVDKDREMIAEIRSGKIFAPIKDIIRMALMIVESPTKAKTIAKFFGKPYRRRVKGLTVYETSTGNLILQITATMGHITDLEISPGFHGVLVEDSRFLPVFGAIKRCMRCGEQFVEDEQCPNCGSKQFFSKMDVVEALRRIALEVNEVYVATDPDAEGEKIAYDLTAALKPYNNNIHRLEFHEVTRKALLNALANRRGISTSLVEAQLVRRIEDRWLGFELSRKLWERFRSRTLSAGRVQTPVLGWIVKRTEEARKRKTILRAILENDVEAVFENPKNLEELREKAEQEKLKARITNLIEEVKEIPPPPPYTTDALLRDAFIYLRFPVGLTMQLAQELFESGLITYHRTDSTTVSTLGLSIAREYIESGRLGRFVPRTYRREGAHECIRPVRVLDRRKLSQYIQIGLIKPSVKLTDRHLRLYDLIFRRFIASQMPAAKVKTQRYTVTLDGNSVELERSVEIIESGFNKVFAVVSAFKRVEEGEYLVKDLVVRKVPAAWLYTEGEIISLMRERGIGRPSTYSKIVQVLFDRNYVFERSGRLIATKRGKVVYTYLEENFGEYVSEDVTRELEKTMDKIEAGELDYQTVLQNLRKQLEEISKVSVKVT